MGRPRKLSPEEVQQAAVDRRNKMSWRELSRKYKCAVNTLRTALSEYSDEFLPIPQIQRSSLEIQLNAAQSEISKIKHVLKTKLNLHV